MNSDLNVVITANTTDLQAALDTAQGSLAELQGTADETSASFISLGGSADDYAANLATIQAAADGAVGSITVVGAAADGAAVEVGVAGEAAGGASAGFDLLDSSMLPIVATMAGLFLGYKGLKDLFSAGKADIDAWNNANAQLGNTLKNGTGVIGITTKQVDALADSTSKGTAITSAATLAADAQLANAKISLPVYQQAAGSIDNIATAMANARGQAVPSSQQMSQAAKLLGTALQNPTTGVNALKRAGIELLPTQQAQIKAMQKAGDVTGAQTLLMEDFADATKNKAATATTTFAGQVAELHKNFDEFSGLLVGKVQQALAALAHAFVMDVLPGIEAAARIIGSIFTPLLHALVDVFKNDLEPVLKRHKTLFEDIAKVIAVLAAAPLIALIAAIAATVAIVIAVIAAFSWLINVITDVANWFRRLYDSVSQAAYNIYEAIVGAIDSVISWFEKLPGSITHAIGDMGNLLYQAGRDLLNGFIRGIENVAGDVMNAVKGIGDKAVSALKGVLKIFSPSQVFSDLGENIGQGLIQGIQGTSDAVAGATGQLANAAIGGANVPIPSSVGGGGGSQTGGANGAIVINVAGNFMEISGQDATNMWDIISRNAELTGMGLTSLMPGTGGAA